MQIKFRFKTRVNCFEKMNVQGRVDGHRRMGRKKLCWTDGIKESARLSLTAGHRLAPLLQGLMARRITTTMTKSLISCC